MAELLVKAKTHWMDNLTESDIDKLDSKKKESYEARSQIGDVIVVRPDGWKWGKAERLPNYIVIKIPDLKIEDAKKYELPLLKQVGVDEHNEPIYKRCKKRKHQIPIDTVTTAKSLNKNSISIDKTEKNTFISNIIEKAE